MNRHNRQVVKIISYLGGYGGVSQANDSTGNAILQKTTQIQHKYNPDYIRFGFVSGGDDVEPRAQCVECAL